MLDWSSVQGSLLHAFQHLVLASHTGYTRISSCLASSPRMDSTRKGFEILSWAPPIEACVATWALSVQMRSPTSTWGPNDICSRHWGLKDLSIS